MCEICGKEFNDGTKFSQHRSHCDQQLKKQKQGPITLYCDFCMKTYMTRNSLLSHIQRNHLKDKPTFLCHLCSNTFDSNYSFMCHMANHRRKMGGIIQCQLCPHKCRKDRMRYHTATVHEGMRFTCVFKDGCDSLLYEKHSLLGHLEAMHNVKEKHELDEYRKLIRELKPIYITAEESAQSYKKKRAHRFFKRR